ncbi:MAG: polymer-forming cytoskeletal protein [Mariprofundaceae bacterium]|nr:polymer-forming cytoskeletal protein [Mariprofundaceae bacterium]
MAFGRTTKPTTNAPSGNSQHIDTLIGEHSKIIGDLNFEGAVRIDGTFEGNIHSSKEGTLIVSEGGKVKGDVSVPNLILHGSITGNVQSSKNLQVGEKGILAGDLFYHIFTVDPGGYIDGRCSHITEDAPAPIAPKKKTTNNKGKATEV